LERVSRSVKDIPFVIFLIIPKQMNTDKPNRQIQSLATVLLLASSYYSVRASLILPEFKSLLDYDGFGRMTSFGDLILGNPGWFLGLVVVVGITTLLAIWKSFKFSEWIVPVGILLQFFLAERAAPVCWIPCSV